MKHQIILLLFFAALIALPASAYELVLKNGKVIRGALISEDEQQVIIKDEHGITLKFKKTLIDVSRTEAANKVVEPTPAKAEPKKVITEETPKKSKKPARVYDQNDVNRLRSEYPMESGEGVQFEEGEPVPAKKGRSGEEWQEITQSLLAAVKEAEAASQQLSAKCKEFQGATIQTHRAITADGKPTDLVQAKEEACQMAEDAKAAVERARQQHAGAVQQARQENIPPGYIVTE